MKKLSFWTQSSVICSPQIECRERELKREQENKLQTKCCILLFLFLWKRMKKQQSGLFYRRNYLINFKWNDKKVCTESVNITCALSYHWAPLFIQAHAHNCCHRIIIDCHVQITSTSFSYLHWEYTTTTTNAHKNVSTAEKHTRIFWFFCLIFA